MPDDAAVDGLKARIPASSDKPEKVLPDSTIDFGRMLRVSNRDSRQYIYLAGFNFGLPFWG